ncbi:MAG: hypothetical protein LBQ40_06205 [Clostridiales bacterium]|jgi:hypothetical protein|nr:hypothetical protein [Clostridiales bacterium]
MAQLDNAVPVSGAKKLFGPKLNKRDLLIITATAVAALIVIVVTLTLTVFVSPGKKLTNKLLNAIEKSDAEAIVALIYFEEDEERTAFLEELKEGFEYLDEMYKEQKMEFKITGSIKSYDVVEEQIYTEKYEEDGSEKKETINTLTANVEILIKYDGKFNGEKAIMSRKEEFSMRFEKQDKKWYIEMNSLEEVFSLFMLG